MCNVCVCVGYCGWLWFNVCGFEVILVIGLLVAVVVVFDVRCVGVVFLNGDVGCDFMGLILCFGCFCIFFIGFGFGLGFGFGFLMIIGVFFGGLGIGLGFGFGFIIGFGGGWMVCGGLRLVGVIIVIEIGCVGVGSLIIWCIEV